MPESTKPSKSVEKTPKPKGGARPGAGRKKGGQNGITIAEHAARVTGLGIIIDKAAERLAFNAIVREHMRPMVEAQVSNALGLKYLVKRDKKTGKFLRMTEEMTKALLESDDPEAAETLEVWSKEPCVEVFKYLSDRLLDKPKDQEQDLNIQGGLEIRWKPVE